MAKNNLIAGLDVGTGHIKLLVARPKEDQSGFDVVCQLKEASYGVRKGVVVDSEKVSRIIQILLNRAREETGEKISAVFTNIGGSHLYCTSSRGMIAVSRADQKVSEVEADVVLAAREDHRLFRVDGQQFVDFPDVGFRRLTDRQECLHAFASSAAVSSPAIAFSSAGGSVPSAKVPIARNFS